MNLRAIAPSRLWIPEILRDYAEEGIRRFRRVTQIPFGMSSCHRVIVPFRLRAKRYGETSPKLEERRRAWLWVALGLVLTVGPLAARQPTPQRPQATFETQSTIVLLDVVVRDKKGRPVRDLRPEELQVFENGQRRELTSFRLVEGQVSEERVAQATASGLQPDPNRQVSLVTMVFDKLMDGRQLSQQSFEREVR